MKKLSLVLFLTLLISVQGLSSQASPINKAYAVGCVQINILLNPKQDAMDVAAFCQSLAEKWVQAGLRPTPFQSHSMGCQRSLLVLKPSMSASRSKWVCDKLGEPLANKRERKALRKKRLTVNLGDLHEQ